MKINTNLTPHEMELVAKGIIKASKRPDKPFKPENEAEKQMMSEAVSALDAMVESLDQEIHRILKDE